jgi:single-strand DNA-binding protein
MFETPLTVVGRVISDISQRTTQSGDPVCSFRIMASERRFNREAQEWADGDRLFIQVTCWRRLAEGVAASLFKGDQVVVTGRLYLDEYEVDGAARSMLQLEARAVGPDLSRCTALVQRADRDGLVGAGRAGMGTGIAAAEAA